MVTLHGGLLSPKLLTDTAYLLVAHPAHSAPHPNFDKINAANRQPETVVVWEGWLNEVVAFGGIRKGRTDLWRFDVGGVPPGEKETFEVDLGAVKKAREEERDRQAAAAREAARLDGLEGEQEVATQRRTKTAKATREHDQAVDALLAGYVHAPASAAASTSALEHLDHPAARLPPRLQPVPLADRTIGSFTADDARRKLGDLPESAPPLAKALEKTSVLRAITSARAGKTERSVAGVAGGFRSRAGAAGASIDNPKSGLELEEDPAFFEDEAKVAESDEEDEPIFEGLKFAVMEMGALGEQVGAGIRRLQGTVAVDDKQAEAEADWVVVPHFK